MADINITADPAVITTAGLTGLLTWTPNYRRPELDQQFDMSGVDEDGNFIFLGTIELTGFGDWISVEITDNVGFITITGLGDWLKGFTIAASPGLITLSVKNIDLLLEKLKKNWVKWSQIGYLDFTIGKDNIAGERPLDWDGFVYAIKKLGNKAIAYGENGVSVLQPVGNTYGLDTIYRIGLKGKNAVCGNDTTHWFIDNRGQLYQLSDSLAKLDYSEYLSTLNSNVVMSYDGRNNLVYICDGVIGYVYRDGSIGKAPANLTGIATKDNILYAVAPAVVVTPPFEICTDIYDFGSRKGKTVNSVEVGTDLTQTLKVAVDYRMDKSQAFSRTGWYDIDKRGMAFVNAYGVEFRFRVKTTAYAYLELDWFKINGYLPN